MPKHQLTAQQRKENVKKLMVAVEPTGLDFHSLQLAVIDVCRSSLLYFMRELDPQAREGVRLRAEKASAEMVQILNRSTESPAEDMLLLYALLDQGVQHGLAMLNAQAKE
jgi:hypothetical protein